MPRQIGKITFSDKHFRVDCSDTGDFEILSAASKATIGAHSVAIVHDDNGKNPYALFLVTLPNVIALWATDFTISTEAAQMMINVLAPAARKSLHLP